MMIILLMICGCQQNNNNLKSSEQEMADLSMLNDSLYVEIAELKEANDVLKEKNEELQKQISMMEVKDAPMELTEQSVAAYTNGFIRFIRTNEKIATYFTMTLIGYNTSVYDEPLDVLDYSNDETPTAKFKVFGTLYNLKIVKVDWNSDFSDYTIKEEICSLNEVTNKSIVFDSVLSEGYPNELLIWENEEGELKYYKISDDGYGFTNKVLICEEYSN
jgi:cell division protein FtsB